MTRWIPAALARFRPSRIGLRLLAFNLLLVFLPVAGILYLDVYESQLLDVQERSMVQQARLAAAALGSGDAVAPDSAMALLIRLGQRGDARIRVFDPSGALIADSVRVPDATGAVRLATDATSEYETAMKGVRQRPLYRVGAWLAGLRRGFRALLSSSPRSPSAPTDAAAAISAEIRAALEGRYGAVARSTPGQRSLTLNSAVPIRSGDRVIGAVLVSQSTFRILQALYEVRLRIFEIVVAALAAAVVLGVLMSATLVRPLVRLRRTALALADRRATPGSFASVTRRDEIGDLARTLEELTTRLDAHIKLLESFAADVAHEFKNPLASIRIAAELATTTGDDVERQRLLAMLVRDVDRLERLVTGVRELARIDTQLAHDALQPVALGGLLRSIVSGVELQGHRVDLSIDGDATSLVVRATEDRLVQVFENLLQNAVSFSPSGSAIDVTARTQSKLAIVQIADRGPGIPEAHLDRVFERFFTYRPNDGSRREHTGLGLAIARAIVEGYGGAIQAGNRDGGGAVFEVRLPLAGRSQAFSGHAQVVSPASDVSGS